jgi:hypothetical protein
MFADSHGFAQSRPFLWLGGEVSEFMDQLVKAVSSVLIGLGVVWLFGWAGVSVYAARSYRGDVHVHQVTSIAWDVSAMFLGAGVLVFCGLVLEMLRLVSRPG